MNGVEVRLLGPVEVLTSGRVVEPGPVQQRTVLAALAVDAGRLVPLEVLIDRVWGDAPPPSVRSGIYSHMARLRRMLVPGGSLLRRPGGYLLDVPPEAVDLHRFRTLSQAARTGPAPDAGTLGAALDLWRGPALAGLAGDWVAATRERLDQLRVEAVLAWAQALLAAGQPGPVIGTLRDFVDQHPLVEPLAARLMEALYASGRAAEALDCYARVRAHLAEELGTEPGPALRQLHQAVLRGDEPGRPAATGLALAVDAAAGAPDGASPDGATPGGGTPDLVTSPLPPDTGAFTGRATQVRQIAEAVGDGPLPVMVIHAIAGMPGVGKTALAVHVAHRLAGRFPDGLVFVDLHGHTAGREPAAPADVLATLLSADGIDPRQLPAGLDARSALWRQRLAGRRLLLVLDNAASSAQVAPLLPAAPGCLVLVTSRRFLGDLPGDTVPVQLDVLSPAEAAQMFRQLANHPAAAEPDRVDGLVAACGFLPLAISLLARVLNRHPSWTVGDLLAETRARLLTVTAEQASVAAAFGLSYQDLPAARQRFFRQLAGHPGTVIEPYAAAALAGLPVPEAAAQLDALHADSLLIEVGYRRYVLHDLIRSYARDLAAADPDAERAAALGRLLDFYQATGARAETRLARQTRPAGRGARRVPDPYSYLDPARAAARAPARAGSRLPDLADAGQALAWARAERASLLACLSAVTDPRRIVELTAALTELLRRDGPWTDAIVRHSAAVRAARRLGDPIEEANARSDLGSVHRLAGDYGRAEQEHGQALELYRAAGSRLGQAHALIALGKTMSRTGSYGHADRTVQQALALYRALGDLGGQASAWVEIAVAIGMTGDYHGALESVRDALMLYLQTGDRAGQAYTLRISGIASCRTGDYAGALESLELALELYQGLGDQAGQALTLTDIGQVAADTGDYPKAATTLGQALRLLRLRNHKIGQAVALVYLGTAARRAGDVPAARAALGEALAIYDELGNCSGRAAAVNEMGALQRLCGEVERAESLHRYALELATAEESAWDEAHARAGVARCLLAQGHHQDAASQLNHALAIFGRVGADQTFGATEITAELAALC
jgi:DNA-binding SARP family transcriptional activator/tetratricopeptide (TPR) repeat protein